MMGITRIRIVSGWNDWRTEMAQELAGSADTIYREAFAGIGMPIADGNAEIECSKRDAMARYDWKEGIDVIFQFQTGVKGTHQEKFLTYHRSTITFEENKTNGEPGAWYYCTAQYYFVGYARQWRARQTREFQDWMIVDLPALHRADAMGEITWSSNKNKRDGRRATFRYAYFNEIPESCIIARYERTQPQMALTGFEF